MENNLKRVAIIFTGGTISMRIDADKGSVVPGLSDEDIIDRAKGIERLAKIEVIHFGIFPGPHMDLKRMLSLSQVIEETLERDDIDGIVVTHGTDVLEETAYLLDLMLISSKPVVVTGAMRNSSELGFDGPANLAAAVCTVCSSESRDMGVLVVMNNGVYAADEVTKTHTLTLDTFKSLDFGPLGIVDQDEVIYYRKRKHQKGYGVKAFEERVGLIKTAAGMDGELVDYMVERGYKGIVIEAMGRGNVPPAMVSSIKRAIKEQVAVVIVSRCASGRVLDSYGYEGGGRHLRQIGVILGDNLSGPKARLKLMVLLGRYKSLEEVKKWFEKDLYKTL